MATKLKKNTMRSVTLGSVHFTGSADTNSTGSVVTTASLLEGRGATLTRSAEGSYHLTFDEKFPAIQYADLKKVNATVLGDGHRIRVNDFDPDNRRVEFDAVVGGYNVHCITVSTTSALGTMSILAFAAPGSTCQLISANFLPNVGLTHNGTNYAVLRVQTVSVSGTTIVANTTSNLTTTAGTGSWTAFKRVPLTIIGTTTLTSGRCFKFNIIKAGSGLATPKGALQLEICTTRNLDIDSSTLSWEAVVRGSTATSR